MIAVEDMAVVSRRFVFAGVAAFVAAAAAASDLDVARAALRDGLWQTAVKYAGKSAKDDPATATQARYVILASMTSMPAERTLS